MLAVQAVSYRVVLVWDREGKAWNVTVPALPGCLTFGETREEALAMAREAIECHIEGLHADGQSVPEDTEVTVEHVEVSV